MWTRGDVVPIDILCVKNLLHIISLYVSTFHTCNLCVFFISQITQGNNYPFERGLKAHNDLVTMGCGLWAAAICGVIHLSLLDCPQQARA
jgi:hypothetical protein